jgi:GNAT superfamily N-acetyltransferase
MEVHSLGLQTNLMLARFSGEVIDRDDYMVVRTPSNPGFHWGNYLVFSRPPKAGDYANWVHVFDREFPYYSEPHHYAFTWEQEIEGDWSEFETNGFKADRSVTLSTNVLSPPPYPNSMIRVRAIRTDAEWNKVLELQRLCSDAGFMNDYSHQFKRDQVANYRRMSEAGVGDWYGAFIDNQLVGNLGIYTDGELLRYQEVGTHPDFRRQGVCATLVHSAGKLALKSGPTRTLVMQAEPGESALRIYQSVGFEAREESFAIQWWRQKPGDRPGSSR